MEGIGCRVTVRRDYHVLRQCTWDYCQLERLDRRAYNAQIATSPDSLFVPDRPTLSLKVTDDPIPECYVNLLEER
jgi:hypothetical protein